MSRPKVLALLCLEMVVLTGAGYYGVLQDEKASPQEEIAAAAAAECEEEQASEATGECLEGGAGLPASGPGKEKPKSQ